VAVPLTDETIVDSKKVAAVVKAADQLRQVHEAYAVRLESLNKSRDAYWNEWHSARSSEMVND
jgi:hypothetical protein